ncbi:hypothetical protein [Microcoleus sp. PH2017_11_PCY_U_A]
MRAIAQSENYRKKFFLPELANAVNRA